MITRVAGHSYCAIANTLCDDVTVTYRPEGRLTGNPSYGPRKRAHNAIWRGAGQIPIIITRTNIGGRNRLFLQSLNQNHVILKRDAYRLFGNAMLKA